MKNSKLFLIAFLLLFIFQVNGQSRFGYKAGVNMANENITARLTGFPKVSEKEDVRFGVNAGVFFEIGKGNFKFQPEINYSAKGSRSIDSTGTVLSTTKLNYLEIPLLAKYYVINSGRFSGYLLGGVYFGRAIAGSVTDEEASLTEKIDFENKRGSYQPFDWGVPAGLGVTFKTRTSTFFLEARYTQGIEKAYSISSGFIGYDEFSKNQVTSVNIGFMFDFGAKQEEATYPEID